MNVIWFPIGLFLTLTYFVLAVVYALTIIGIPVAIVYVRMGIRPRSRRVQGGQQKQAFASAVANEMERRLNQ